MATKSEVKAVKPASETSAFDEFRAGVRYLLVHDQGMPELVADDILNGETEYLEEAFQSGSDRKVRLQEIADELAFRPRTNSEWIRLQKGQMIVNLNSQVREVVETIATTGLYGTSAEDVAVTLLSRGVEAVMPVTRAMTGRLLR